MPPVIFRMLLCRYNPELLRTHARMKTNCSIQILQERNGYPNGRGGFIKFRRFLRPHPKGAWVLKH